MEGLLSTLLLLFAHKNTDVRFNSLKAFAEIALQLLSVRERRSRTLDDLIINQLIPACQQVLNDREPIPQYGLKLLIGLTSLNSTFSTVLIVTLVLKFLSVFALEKADLISKLLTFLHSEHKLHQLAAQLLAIVTGSPSINKLALLLAGTCKNKQLLMTVCVVRTCPAIECNPLIQLQCGRL